MIKWPKALLVILLIAGCKEPFTPKLSASNNNKYLVIEGVISGGSDSTFIKLSTSKKIDTSAVVNPVTGAHLTVESDANSTFALNEITPGTYAAPPVALDVTHRYRLKISTADNKQYESDLVQVKNSPVIDSVGFVAQQTGVQIYANTHDDANTTRYYRWDYSENWQFHSKYVSTTNYDLTSRAVSQQVYNCFGSDKSANIVIASSVKLTKDLIYNAPITTIPSSSEKIEIRYSILVKQYALTSDAYDFWQNLQKNTEKIGSIFDVLPSEVQSNYHCISNPTELVIGYLSVGNTATKRIFINASQLLPGYVTAYPCACERDTAFNSPTGHQNPTSILIPPSPYTPIDGLYVHPPTPFGKPDAYSYSIILCVDCTVRGTTAPPPFWK